MVKIVKKGKKAKKGKKVKKDKKVDKGNKKRNLISLIDDYYKLNP